MKIEKISIKNFKSIKSIELDVKNMLALVGRNNAGKSNILRALDLFFEGTTRSLSRKSFYNEDQSTPIEINITFGNLSDWEREKFAPYMNGDKLIVGRRYLFTEDSKYEMKVVNIVSVPEAEWLREHLISSEKITEWWNNRTTLRIGALDFSTLLGNARPRVSDWKESARNFVNANRNVIPFVEEERINPEGAANVLKGFLPEFIFVPAVRDVTDEAKVTKTNPFGILISSVFEKISDVAKQTLGDKLNDVAKLLLRGSDQRIGEIRDFEARLNVLMKQLIVCEVDIEIPLPEVREVFGTAKIFVNDGWRTAVEDKGHGLQRSMIFTILRLYAEVSHIKKAQERANERSTIFAIEEPELYLHPQFQRTLMSVFRTVASGGDQIFYSTQSSIFVDVAYFDEICLVRRSLINDLYESGTTQLSMQSLLDDLRARKGVNGTQEGMRLLYSHAFNPQVNEGFFADKVVIVEGPSEVYSFPVYASALGVDFDKLNISVVPSGGKGSMDRLLRIFNGFKIPTYVVFDGDKGNPDKETTDKTLELADLLGFPFASVDQIATVTYPSFTAFETKYEAALQLHIASYEQIAGSAKAALGPTGKPLTHKFLAHDLKVKYSRGDTDAIPTFLKEIVQSIQNATYRQSILRT